MKLVQLVYFSSVVGGLVQDDIQSLLKHAQQKNSAAGVSGLLLFSNQHFLQVLEGPRTEVNTTYYRIQNDKRHRDPIILLYKDIHARDFCNWAMSWATDVKIKKEIYFRYCSRPEFLPNDLTGESALALLRDMKEFVS